MLSSVFLEFDLKNLARHWESGSIRAHLALIIVISLDLASFTLLREVILNFRERTQLLD